MPRLGRQPGLAVMKKERWTLAALARHIEVSHPHLCNVMYGRTYPSSTLLDRLPAVLGVPNSELFNPDVLTRAAEGVRPGRPAKSAVTK